MTLTDMVLKVVVLVSLLLPALCTAGPIRVFVSVPPQKTFVEKVGGHHVEVLTMVRPGYNPATYNPTPRQISALASTALYVRTGVPFEKAWMKRIRSANRNMQVLDARTGVDLRLIEHSEHGHEHVGGDHPQGEQTEAHHGEAEHDPHVWTSPPMVKHMSRNVRDALIALDPANSQDYAHNYGVFAAELDALDRDIRALLQDLPTRKFMVYHPAWGYFADTYGLVQVPVEIEGKEPGARTLSALIRQAKRDNVKVIFVQPQFDDKSARQLARAIGGSVVAIDPLSSDYMDNLRQVTRQIADAAGN